MVKEILEREGLPPSTKQTPFQCSRAIDALLIDWAMTQDVFNVVPHAQNSLNKLKAEAESLDGDDDLAKKWMANAIEA